MNEKNHNPDERMDRILRKWGADEASRQVNIPPMPELTPQRRWRTILLRWGPPAAAAAMLLVAAGLFIGGRSGDVTAPVAQEQEDVRAIKMQLVQARTDLQEARAALSQADSRHAGEVERLNTEIAAMKKDFQNEKENFLAGAEKQIADLNRIVKTQNEKLETITGELEKSGEALAAAKERYDKLIIKGGKARAQLAAAVSELGRVGKTYRRTLADSQKVQAELSTIKIRHRSVLANFQRAYLSAAATAGGMEQPRRRIDLSVRRSACRGAKLLARCAEIRPSVQADPTGRLVDRLEVVLTRLNLLNPADPAEARAFAALVRRGELVKKIDETLATGRQRADIRIWLLETKLVLEGAENVG